MKNVFAFIFGGLFALGLMVSGMSNPEKVLGFLDIFGEWDISLMFVMIGLLRLPSFHSKKRSEIQKHYSVK